MKRVSLHNYVKDYRNNTATECIKYKPVTGYKGTATIQLFNANTGELEVEAVSENVINNCLSKIAFDAMYRYGANNSTAATMPYAPFMSIGLSDTAIPEDADAVYLQGNFCGYATREAYSGVSAHRGTLNTAESFYDDRSTPGKIRCHLVFDFPTHCANGTIRTIYWMNSAQAFSESLGVHRMTYQAYQTTSDIILSNISETNVIRKNAMDFIHSIDDSVGKVGTKNNRAYIDESSNTFYLVRTWHGTLTLGKIDMFSMLSPESDFVKLKYEDGAYLTSYPTVMAAHIDPQSQRVKVLFYTDNVTYKDMPNTYTFYEFTFDFSGSFIERKSFSRTVLRDANNQYPIGYNQPYWFYDDDGRLNNNTSYHEPNTNPIMYSNVCLKMTADLSAIESSEDLSDLLAEALNSREKMYNSPTIFTKDSMILKNACVELSETKCRYMKDFYFLSFKFPSTSTYTRGDIWFAVKKSDRSVFFTNTDVSTSAITSGVGSRYSARGSNVGIAIFTSASTYRYSTWQYYTTPSAQNLLPANVVKTSVNTMKIQYDFIVDDADVLPYHDI